MQRRGDRDGDVDGGHRADQPSLDHEGDDRAVPEKAGTSLRAQARLDPPDFSATTEGVELTIPVSVTDKAGTEAVHADITCWVTPAH